jgi:hypothetical protein
MAEPKRILMVPIDKQVEALRMASGLTLLDDAVAIAAWDALPAGPEVDEQMEALEFADVPMDRLDRDIDQLAQRIINSDVVFFV